MEKLHELHDDGNFDLIVIDTPPTRHALDFLDAPRRLLRLLDNRIFRMLMMPTRAYLRVASVAVQTFLRTVAQGRRFGGDRRCRVVLPRVRRHGSRLPRPRARGGGACSPRRRPGFVLVTSPRRDAMEEAQYFSQQLAGTGKKIDALDRESRAPELR